MTGLPWATDGELSTGTVRAILARQFPALADARVEYLDEGWDNVVFEVDATWLLRFPKRAEVVPSLAVELALLPLIAPRLPLPIPRFELHGEPSELFPRPFAGYRKLAGVTGDEIRPTPEQLERLAPQLAGFLSALHAIPVAEPIRLGVPQKTRSRSPSRLRERVVERFHLVRGAAPELLARAERFLERALPDPYFGELRLIHADFTCSHLLLDGDTVSGVIDWTDAEIGDPAADLAGLLHWAGEPLFDAVLAAYPFADAGLLERARYTATCVGFYDIFYGVEAGKPDCVALGVRALDLNLPR